MRRRYDLHLHTSRSDGEHEPAEVLRRCAAGGLDVVALTDHDIAPLIPPGVYTVDDRQISVIAAVEASGMHDGTEIHLLAYFPGAVPDGFVAFSQRQVAARVDRYDAAAAVLGLAPAESRSGERAYTRHHLARALVACGKAANLRDAFSRYVGDGCGIVPRMQTPADEVIATAQAHGAVVSWAHPSKEQVDRWLPDLVARGLQGVEAYRPSLTSRDRRVLRDAARRHKLLVTGGSDWHGWFDAGPGLFAVDDGEIAQFVERLAA